MFKNNNKKKKMPNKLMEITFNGVLFMRSNVDNYYNTNIVFSNKTKSLVWGKSAAKSPLLSCWELS